MVQGDKPEWDPLLNLAGEGVTGEFMWMFEVRLGDGTALHAYKHRLTRRYVHLTCDGRAFTYEPEDRYRPTAAAGALDLALAGSDTMWPL